MLWQCPYNRIMLNVNAPDKAHALGSSELFRQIAPAELEQLASRWVWKVFPANATLFSAEQVGDGVYVIVRGTVKIHVEQLDGSDVFIEISGAGDVLGEMSVVENAGRSATARAMEETVCLWLAHAAFQELLLTTPPVSQNLMRILSARLRAANERIQAMSRLDVKHRIARQLVVFANRYGARDAHGHIVIQIRLTQAELADLVGATRERVNQVLGELRREELIEIDAANHITLRAPEMLGEWMPG